MDKKTLSFLKRYGFTLNSPCPKCEEVREYLKKDYPEEYYMYVDLKVRKKAMRAANKLKKKDYENMKLYYKEWDKVFKRERKKITKDILQNR